MNRVLNVGGGNKRIAIPDHYAGFEHVLLDIDPLGEPDIVMDTRNLAELAPGQFDAVYCSHNLEHYFPHEVPIVLEGFVHVLAPDGFAEIRVPDLEMVMKTVVAKGLDIEDVLYSATAGPILVRDVLYGWGAQIEKSGEPYYAHKTGFSQKTMAKHLLRAGFERVYRRPGRGVYELNVLAFRSEPSDAQRSLLNLKIASA